MKRLFAVFLAVFLLPALLWAEDVVLPQTIGGLEKLAKAGDVEAQYRLGYESMGLGDAPLNILAALRWTRIAAENDHPKAQYNLGSFYYNGYGVAQNPAQAIYWWRRAAEHGLMEAQSMLNAIYVQYGGDPESFDWWYTEATRGTPGTPFFVGAYFHNGIGVPQNYDEASKWFLRGAAQGDPRAQNSLGVMAYNKKRDREAYKWFNLAAAQGDEEARANRDDVRLFLTPTQIERAQNDSLKWAASHY